MKRTIIRFALAVSVLLAGTALVSSSRSGTPDYAATSAGRLLDIAEEKYFDADVNKALEILDQVVQRDGLSDDERIGAYLLEAYCYTARKEEGPAKRAIKNAWKVRNELPVDPDVVPPKFMWHYYDIMKELKVDQRVNTVAVLYFTNNSITDHDALDPLCQGIADMVQVGLLNVEGIAIVERDRIDYILKELKLQKSDEFDDEARARIGKLLGVRYIMTGSFTRIEDKLRIVYRLIEVETGEVLGGDEVDGKWKEIIKVIDRTGHGVIGEIEKQMPIEVKKWESKQIDPDALMRYSEGLVLMDAGKYGEARDNFLLAMEITPGFDKARKRVRQLTAVAALEEGTITRD